MADITNQFYASNAWIGYGAQFLVGQGTGSPEEFVAVPEINAITPGDMTTGIVDVTHLRSPGRHREKRGTIRDSGPITLTGNYDPTHGAHKQEGGDGFSATHSLLSLWRNVTQNNFQIVLPEEAGTHEPGSPFEAIVLPIRGVVTTYQIGEMTLEGKVPFTAAITPLQDYSGDFK